MGFRKAVLASVVSFVAVVSLFAAPAAAVDRSEGDYWVYQGGMDYDVFEVSGGYRYEFEKADTVSIGMDSYDVNVLKVTGSMVGETEDFLGVSASIDLVFDGYVYELDGSMATVKDDMHTWANVTLDFLTGELVTRTEVDLVSSYSPPLLTGFVDGETGTGDEWEETTTVTQTSTVWIGDDLDSTSTDDYTETYSFVVAAAEETVETDAGTFTCLKMTATDGSGNYEVYWYSSDVGSWVKLSSYFEGDATPYMTLELTEYQYSDGSLAAVLILVGVGVLVAVVAIVIIVLLMRKRGQTPVQVPQQAPPPPPPSN